MRCLGVGTVQTVVGFLLSQYFGFMTMAFVVVVCGGGVHYGPIEAMRLFDLLLQQIDASRQHCC